MGPTGFSGPVTTPAANGPAARFPACVPPLTDGVVLLRAHSADDVPRIVEQCQDAEMLAWTIVPRPYDDASARGFLEFVEVGWNEAVGDDPRAVRHWAVARAEDPDRFLGSIHLQPTGGGSAEVGYGMHPRARGAGLMPRAVRLLQSYAVHEMGVDTVHWRALVGNWSSRRVAWACGFTHAGTLRAALTHPTLDGSGVHDADGWAASWRAGEPTVPRHPWYAPVELRANGLLLRAWRDEDGAALGAARDEVADRFLPGLVPTATTYGVWLADRREREASGTGVAWAIVADPTDPTEATHPDGARESAVLGGIHLFDMGNARRAGNATVGVFVLPQARGQGLFGYALEVVLDHAFTPVEAGGLGLARVRSDADVANTASVRAMLRAGMTYVGTTREERPDTRAGFSGERVDMCSFEVLAGDDRAMIGELNRRGWSRPRTIYGDGVRLREFTEDDAPFVARLMRDPEFGPAHRADAGEADARRWVIRGLAENYRGRELRWAICPMDPPPGFAAGEPVGCVRAFGLDGLLYSGDAEIGYTLHPHARGRGLAAAAARALVDYLLAPTGKDGYGLRRVTAITAPENVASQCVLQAAGLSRWFVDPCVVLPHSPASDLWRYGRLNHVCVRALADPGRPDTGPPPGSVPSTNPFVGAPDSPGARP